MSAQHYASQYKSNGLASKVLDATPHRLVAMMLEGAASRIRLALNSLEHGDRARKGKAIAVACEIIAHLESALDRKAGGEVADNLSALYRYVLLQLTDANLRNDPALLREALDVLGRIESAWTAIAVAPLTRDGDLAWGHA